MGSKTHQPGERVPTTGIYKVEHESHRLMHHAILTQGMLFPRCRTCGDRVRFSLVRSVKNQPIPFRSSDILEEFTKARSAGS
ncbi:MAG TPA: hypothetical protein VFI72_18610 [Candidatus Angelobacter sp.]|nr:hypothetical protein [Candidatus Angelobacter sp.]